MHTRPVEVPGASSGIAAVSAGYKHICVVTTGGAARCWGVNDHGQLGDGTTEERPTPVDVTGLGSGVAAITAGDGYTCALLTTGAARCWGNNADGQLGDGTTDQRLAPVAVSALGSTVTSIAAAWWHACAITTQGAVHCWGQNKYGELGGEPTAPKLAPSAVPGLEAGYTSVRPGKRYTCALGPHPLLEQQRIRLPRGPRRPRGHPGPMSLAARSQPPGVRTAPLVEVIRRRYPSNLATACSPGSALPRGDGLNPPHTAG
ncbi:MAG: hypothetical protein WKG00_27890 [Polyangiaceae bacterium]